MDVRSRGVFHLSGVLVYFILISVVTGILHANIPTFLSYHKLSNVHDSELLHKFNTPATLWAHRNSDFHSLLIGLYQAMQTLSQSMKPAMWHHAETKLYSSHGNPDVTHSVSNQRVCTRQTTCSCDSSDSLLRGSCPSRSATDPP